MKQGEKASWCFVLYILITIYNNNCLLSTCMYKFIMTSLFINSWRKAEGNAAGTPQIPAVNQEIPTTVGAREEKVGRSWKWSRDTGVNGRWRRVSQSATSVFILIARWKRTGQRYYSKKWGELHCFTFFTRILC